MGAAVHESQSLLMELQVCRGREFISQIAPLIRQSFDIADSDTAWSTENLYRQATRVERGFIRVDADELSYPLHVILRFELERGLLEGKLAVFDDSSETETITRPVVVPALEELGYERAGAFKKLRFVYALRGACTCRF